MKFKIIASGSKGNCTYLEVENQKILIDIGISYKRVKEALENLDIDPKDITDVFITHEHLDHVSGLGVFFNQTKSNAKLHLSKGTMLGLLESSNDGVVRVVNDKIKNDDIMLFRPNHNHYDDVVFNNLYIKPIPIFHDANEPVGFIFTYEEKKLVFLTDSGYIHHEWFSILENATCYILETNYDVTSLMNSDRPFYLKQRILSQDGHLSNEDSIVALTKLIGKNTKFVLHAHISSDCNCKTIIQAQREKIFEELNFIVSDVHFTEISQGEDSELIVL